MKIPAENIFRTPLTEKNFILFDEFIDLEKYLAYRKLDINFIKEQKKKNIKKPLGLLKLIGINLLIKNREKTFKPNKGSSTFTFLYKNENKGN
jgi:hypothetical protein